MDDSDKDDMIDRIKSTKSMSGDDSDNSDDDNTNDDNMNENILMSDVEIDTPTISPVKAPIDKPIRIKDLPFTRPNISPKTKEKACS